MTKFGVPAEFLRDVDMTLTEVEKALGSVAAQLMNGEVVLLEGQKIPVKRVGSGRLRMVQFRMNGRVFGGD